MWRIAVSTLLFGSLMACSSTPLVTQQPGELTRGYSADILPPEDARFAIAQPLPKNTAVSLVAPRRSLSIEEVADVRVINEARLFTDANGLPIIELPVEPSGAARDVEAAIASLEWTIRQINYQESRISIDGSPWLERRGDQLFPARPQINIYFYSFSNGTQIHMEREGELSFPISTQRELLQTLFDAL